MEIEKNDDAALDKRCYVKPELVFVSHKDHQSKIDRMMEFTRAGTQNSPPGLPQGPS